MRSTLAVGAAALAIPFLDGVSRVFGFVPLTGLQLGALLAIVVLYAATTEATKMWFHRWSTGSAGRSKAAHQAAPDPDRRRA